MQYLGQFEEHKMRSGMLGTAWHCSLAAIYHDMDIGSLCEHDEIDLDT